MITPAEGRGEGLPILATVSHPEAGFSRSNVRFRYYVVRGLVEDREPVCIGAFYREFTPIYSQFFIKLAAAFATISLAHRQGFGLIFVQEERWRRRV
jgi:hypothetical protein